MASLGRAARDEAACARVRSEASGSSGSRLRPAGRSKNTIFAVTRGIGSNGGLGASIETLSTRSSMPSPSRSAASGSTVSLGASGGSTRVAEKRVRTPRSNDTTPSHRDDASAGHAPPSSTATERRPTCASRNTRVHPASAAGAGEGAAATLAGASRPPRAVPFQKKSSSASVRSFVPRTTATASFVPSPSKSRTRPATKTRSGGAARSTPSSAQRVVPAGATVARISAPAASSTGGIALRGSGPPSGASPSPME